MIDEQTNHDVTTLDGLRAAVQLHAPETQHNFAIVTGTHCPQCGADRRMVLSALLWTNRWTPQKIRRRQLGVVLEGQGGVRHSRSTLPIASQTQRFTLQSAFNVNTFICSLFTAARTGWSWLHFRPITAAWQLQRRQTRSPTTWTKQIDQGP
jgi:hypothetical protein